MSVYGATKVSNEVMAQSYFDRYVMPVSGLRFFKVYGPWGRPDTVFFKFADRIYHDLPVDLYNHGEVSHSFTYIDDVVGGVLAALYRNPESAANTRHPIFNLGNPESKPLIDCLAVIQRCMGKQAQTRLLPLPPGDRSYSRANIDRAREQLGYQPLTSVQFGIERFMAWYLDEYVPMMHNSRAD